MFTRKRQLVFAATLSAGAGLLSAAATIADAAPVTAAGTDTPRLGRAATVQHIRAADITVMPDGEGLPVGSGTAVTGAELYRVHCLACHGERGVGGPNDVLAGGRGSLTSAAPLKTVGSYWPYAATLFDYIRRAMPYPSPGVLSNAEVYSLTAYLLYVNGIIGERVEMNAATLPAVQMPNRDNFRVSW
ncbi:MAG: cytochrome c [Gammaproteobacteria bacterium]|nr:cytochrome c [Gammaproteobacteria bacterium]